MTRNSATWTVQNTSQYYVSAKITENPNYGFPVTVCQFNPLIDTGVGHPADYYANSTQQFTQRRVYLHIAPRSELIWVGCRFISSVCYDAYISYLDKLLAFISSVLSRFSHENGTLKPHQICVGIFYFYPYQKSHHSDLVTRALVGMKWNQSQGQCSLGGHSMTFHGNPW